MVGIEELAGWLKLKLGAPVWIGDIPPTAAPIRQISLTRSGGPPARGAAKNQTVGLRVYAETLADADLFYAEAEALLLGPTRLKTIVSINHESGPSAEIDDQRAASYVRCLELATATADRDS